MTFKKISPAAWGADRAGNAITLALNDFENMRPACFLQGKNTRDRGLICDLKTVARALGGEIVNGQVAAPGPGHSAKDRSLTVKPSSDAPDGFIVYSHAGDDFRDCRDHVRSRLGISPDGWKRELRPARPRPVKHAPGTDDAERTASALRLWRQSGDPRGTLGEAYLRSRGLSLSDELAGEALRWHGHTNALVGLFRNVHTAAPQAVTRIFLDRDGHKVERKFAGPVGGAAVMIDPFEAVAMGLHIGEGVETCLAGRQLGFKPAWALGSAGAIANFPVLGGIDAITIFAETDKTGVNERAIKQVAARWRAAGRDVFVAKPEIGDMNDALGKGRTGA